MSGRSDFRNLPTSFKLKDPRPVEREKAEPTGNAAKDGYTRHARRRPKGVPGDFMDPGEREKYDELTALFPPYED